MEGTPAHLPFTFVRFGGHACKSPGHAGKNFVVDMYIKCTLKSHINKAWLNCKKTCLILERQPESTLSMTDTVNSYMHDCVNLCTATASGSAQLLCLNKIQRVLFLQFNSTGGTLGFCLYQT